MENKQYLQKISDFNGLLAPEEGQLVGYGALIKAFALRVPPSPILSLISQKRRRYSTEAWQVFTPKHTPEDTLYGQLTFALKYEGIHLLILKKVFEKVSKVKIAAIITAEPLGQYSRRIWFLYEWLMHTELDIPDLKTGNFIPLVDETMQYTGKAIPSRRHRLRNNLPGTPDFCPMIRKTSILESFIGQRLAQKNSQQLKTIHKDMLLRASAFLLLKDSKATFAIEGEQPPQDRAQRWGKAIGQAGSRELSKTELLRLQQIVIGDDRFTPMGWRQEGGFVGEHDRATAAPIPDHISAKWEDIDILLTGLIETTKKLEKSSIDPVLVATMIAFGFVFIHPLVDGNGRIHRYLIHHVLARMNFAQKGIIFPVSSAIFERINEYRRVLEAYSTPVLECIEWSATSDHNIEVLNETLDFYRFFDATKQAEFLYACVEHTINTIIPEEIACLYKYDEMKTFMDNNFAMPDKLVAILMRFLEQNDGFLSKRALSKEFKILKKQEVLLIEQKYQEIFVTTTRDYINTVATLPKEITEANVKHPQTHP